MYDALVSFLVGVLVGLILGVLSFAVIMVIKNNEEQRGY